MTTWAIGHTKRCGGDCPTTSDELISLFGTSDIGFYFNPEELGTDLLRKVAWRRTGGNRYGIRPAGHNPIRLLHGEWDAALSHQSVGGILYRR